MTTTERKITLKWCCNECGELHDRRWDARQCCPPCVYEVYVCPECAEQHRTEEWALECCPEEGAEPAYRRCDYTHDMFGTFEVQEARVQP